MSDWKNRTPVKYQGWSEDMAKEVVVRNGKMALVKSDKLPEGAAKTIGLFVASPLIGVGLALMSTIAFSTTVFVPIIIFLSLFFAMGIAKQQITRESGSHDIADRDKDGVPNKNFSGKRASIVPPPAKTEYECPNFAAVLFETKLLKEEVITLGEMSLCDMNGCTFCAPFHARLAEEILAEENKAIAARKAAHKKTMAEIKVRNDARAKERDTRQLNEMSGDEAHRVYAWNDAKSEDSTYKKVYVTKTMKDALIKTAYEPERTRCAACNTDTWFIGRCPACRLVSLLAQDENDKLAKIAAKKAEAAAKRAEKKRLFEERRHVNLNGLALYRPDGVPEGAVPSLLHGRDIDPMATHSFIVWKWTEDGQNTKFFKQPVVADAYSVMSDQHPGAVKSWYSVTDGNGRYVGDYSTVNGHLPKERHEDALKAHFKDGGIIATPMCRDAGAHQLTGDCGCWE